MIPIRPGKVIGSIKKEIDAATTKGQQTKWYCNKNLLVFVREKLMDTPNLLVASDSLEWNPSNESIWYPLNRLPIFGNWQQSTLSTIVLKAGSTNCNQDIKVYPYLLKIFEFFFQTIWRAYLNIFLYVLAAETSASQAGP